MQYRSGWLAAIGAASVVFLASACNTDDPGAPSSMAITKPQYNLIEDPPTKVSSAGDLALNQTRTGYPSPMESSPGWGGGWNTWEIVDGLRTYDDWAHGLAFTPCGLRQATINFGTPRTFNQVVVWHHAPYHVPYTYNIQYWDGASWSTVFSTVNKNGHDYMAYPQALPDWWYYNTPTVNTFPAVTGSKVKYELINCEGPDGWAYSHGWIYEFEVYLTNRDPVADAGTDQTVEAVGPDGATVTLVGSGSTDPDGNPLTYAWSLAGTPIGAGPSPEVTLGLGTHTILLTVDDGNGGTATDEVVVTVVDTRPPTIDMVVAPTVLLTPNHKLVLVASHITAADLCCTPALLVEVASNEPVNGGGDGDTEPDWQVTTNSDGSVDVWVRAERSGIESGRVYTITATATDCAGNIARAIGTVTVPHDKKKK